MCQRLTVLFGQSNKKAIIVLDLSVKAIAVRDFQQVFIGRDRHLGDTRTKFWTKLLFQLVLLEEKEWNNRAIVSCACAKADRLRIEYNHLAAAFRKSQRSAESSNT